MASSIGIYSFITLEGELDPPQPRLQDITRPGVDGTAYKLMGTRSNPTQLLSYTTAANAAAAGALLTAYAGLTGSLVTIVHHGVTYPNMLVISVQPVFRAFAHFGGSSGWIVRAAFTVQYAGV